MVQKKSLVHIAPFIETSRLYLRPFNLSDAAKCAEMGWKDKNKPIKTVLHAKSYLKSIIKKDDGYYLGVFSKEDNSLVGDLEFCHLDWYRDTAGEICYGINSKYRGKGYATEASAGLIDYLFREVKIHKVTADTDPDNFASQNVLKKLHFIREGIARKKNYDDDTKCWKDEYNFGLLSDEWMSKQKVALYKK